MSALSWLVIIVVVVITVVVLVAYSTAQRLDRLHIRTDSARLSLQAALDRRAAVVAALLPETSTKASAAESIVLDYGNFDDRAAAEREVSMVIAGLEPDVPAQLVDANVRVQLAHRFYNDAVADTRSLRMRPAVRFLRLGGTAALPEFFEFSSF